MKLLISGRNIKITEVKSALDDSSSERKRELAAKMPRDNEGRWKGKDEKPKSENESKGEGKSKQKFMRFFVLAKPMD